MRLLVLQLTIAAACFTQIKPATPLTCLDVSSNDAYRCSASGRYLYSTSRIGQPVYFVPATNNIGASSFELSEWDGSRAIKRLGGTDTQDGDIIANQIVGVARTLAGTWQLLQVPMPPPSEDGGVPAGLITMSLTTCPSGWSEATELNGVMVRGTLAANGDVGTTGGSDSITPAGTINTQTFTGAGLGTHLHGVGTYANGNESAHTHGGPTVSWPVGVPTNAAEAVHTHTYTEVPNHVHPYCSQTSTSGSISSYEHGTIDTSSAATECSMLTNNPSGGVASGTTAAGSSHNHVISWPAGVPTNGATGAGAAHTHTPSGSSEAVSAGTPAGTIQQAALTGTAFDNRPAFLKVIFCKKD